MKRILSFILTFTLLILFSSFSVLFADDYQDGVDAFDVKDYKKAFKKFQHAAEQKNSLAQYRLGEMYANGLGVIQNYKEAVKWYRLSLNKGNIHSRVRIYGLAMKKVPQALKFLKDDAEHGHAESLDKLYSLAVNKVPQALKLLRNGAEWGHVEFIKKLAKLYSDETVLPENYIDAHMWLNLASSRGNKEAVLSKNILEKRMSPEQIEEAQERAREWKPIKIKWRDRFIFFVLFAAIYMLILFASLGLAAVIVEIFGLWKNPEAGDYLGFFLVYSAIALLSIYVSWHLADYVTDSIVSSIYGVLG